LQSFTTSSVVRTEIENIAESHGQEVPKELLNIDILAPHWWHHRQCPIYTL